MYSFLPGFGDIHEGPPSGVEPQLVFFFDSGNLERSGSSVKHIASHATIVNIDHHPSNSRFGDVNVIDPNASAVGQMVMEMLDHFGYRITQTIATNLYVALLTDTGGFRHENTTVHALEDAARLASLGADPGQIATMVYKMRPETTLKLSGQALATMRVEMQGRLAWAKVTKRMLREANAGADAPTADLEEACARLGDERLRPLVSQVCETSPSRLDDGPFKEHALRCAVCAPTAARSAWSTPTAP